jgi:hypothetical protein
MDMEEKSEQFQHMRLLLAYRRKMCGEGMSDSYLRCFAQQVLVASDCYGFVGEVPAYPCVFDFALFVY